jgi:hypothetical protein
MAYRYTTSKGDWTLYNRQVQLNGGRNQTIYFFSRGEPRSGAPADMPTGYTVMVAEKTGLPILRKA